LQCVGTYHSHPYDESFEGWAEPSNADCAAADYLKLPYFLIIAIARNGKRNKQLTIEKMSTQAYKFTYDPNMEGNGWPPVNSLERTVSYIAGEFQKYQFEIRAYTSTKNGLESVDLLSSEAELIGLLKQANRTLHTITAEETYRLRKMEYNVRKENEERGKGNLTYHLERL
jgi:hypothetical protein